VSAAQFEQEEPEVELTSSPPLIQVENLSKSYGPVRALDGVSFQVDEGEILGFLGPNGAGKTTALRILAGFLPGDQGTVRVAGHDVERDSVAVRSNIGYLPEGVPLYPEMRVSEYLRFRARLKGVPFWERRGAIDRVLEASGTADVRRRIIGTLSRGYRQRVGLADTLLGEPRVLLLDEPTVGLDPEQVRQFRSLLHEVGRERTVMLSTHILSEVELVCSRVLIINRGRIEASDTAESLRRLVGGRACSVLAEIAGPQAAVTRSLEAISLVTRVERGAAPLPGPDGGPGDGKAAAAYRCFRIYTPADVDVREAVFLAVQRGGWTLRHLQREVDEPSLEEVFIDIVGRKR
jgi:ABC-2 type transport system ATP-binding protein